MVVFYAILLFLCGAYLWRIRRQGARVSFIFLVLWMVFHGPALFAYVFIWSGHFEFGLLDGLSRMYQMSEGGDLIDKVFLAMSLSLASFMAGWLAYSALMRLDLRRGMADASQPFEPLVDRRRLIIWAIVSEVVIVGVLLWNMATNSTGPSLLFDYYLSDIYETQKIELRRSIQWPYFYSILVQTVFSMLAVVLIAEAIISRHSTVRLHAWLMTGLVLIAKIAYLNKTGPVLFLMQAVLAYALLRQGSIGFNRRVISVGLGGIAIFVLLTWSINTIAGGEELFMATFDRLLMIPNEVIFEYFSAIPAAVPHTDGLGSSWAYALFGDPTQEFVPAHTTVGAVYRGTFGTVVNGFFLSDAWSEFAWAGVIGISAAAGCLVRWYDHQALLWGKTSIGLGLIIAGFGSVYTLATGSLTTAMITGGLLLNPLALRLFSLRGGGHVHLPAATTSLPLQEMKSGA
jgi:hypothetical protein